MLIHTQCATGALDRVWEDINVTAGKHHSRVSFCSANIEYDSLVS